MKKRKVSHQANYVKLHLDALTTLSTGQSTPYVRMSDVERQAAFVPTSVAVARAHPCEGLEFDVNIPPAVALTLTHLTRRQQGLPLADTSQYSEQQWEQMKPIIQRMYLGEGKTLDDVMSTMSLVYRFQAR
jgi:hypothetical protein